MHKDKLIPLAIIGLILIALFFMIVSMMTRDTNITSSNVPATASGGNPAITDLVPQTSATGVISDNARLKEPVRRRSPSTPRPPLINMQPMFTSTQLFEKKEYPTVTGRILTYYILTPERPYPPDIRFPLVIALHDERGIAYAAEALAQETARIQYPAIVVVPLAPYPALWASPDPAKYNDENFHYVKELLDEVILSYPVDHNRIYIAGCGSGGTGTIAALARHPDFFTAGIAISGNWSESDATKLINAPLIIRHGAHDNKTPVEQARKMVNAIRNLGGLRIVYDEDPLPDHTCSARRNYEEPLWDWLYAQKK